jgi:hypothetical protein
MSERAARDEFRARLKREWSLLWGERFDDRVRAEGISVRDYPLLLVDKGLVIFASRDAKNPSFSEVVSYWSGEGRVYSPDPDVGGWGRFIRSTVKRQAHSRADEYKREKPSSRSESQQSKKGGRGWLHK